TKLGGGVGDGAAVRFSATAGAAGVEWQCRSADVALLPDKYLPANCRGT
ncbi:MAG: pilin, partial [Gammaproteobacteria bacterium]|nr:pilin [Gammaproteobacteria bacterium]